MRSLLSILIAVTLLAFGGFLWSEYQAGAGLRHLELQAAAHSEAIMRAQETHRLRHMDQEESPLYVSIDELVEEGLLSGFEALDSSRGGTLHERDGYLYLVQLLPSPDPEGIRPQLGQRYRLWAWPLEREHLGLVLYYGSSAGYLFQGENGECSGREPLLPERTPLQTLDAAGASPSREARRWKQLRDIRAQADPAGSPQK